MMTSGFVTICETHTMLVVGVIATVVGGLCRGQLARWEARLLP